ncbi:DUF4214 domain-containing protein [Tianweitania sp. BSSL-BM11]|uniref:DUF4214 domain-containing protein n=1 Tax=Tianweitania aestuarii TaxID=2814886 RepID=A0ABS5RW99_9HYPH|nr:DUF4214 domain-containing protein [Tianweitania aestuarii]MBS9721294.1 DUF4214 domain-containing protein [Tianweitania aestuarii]
MDEIQKIYIALFGRPADPLGLEYFAAETKNGADLTAIGDLASTDEYQSRFEGDSNAQIINAIYLQLFDRPADAAGLAFFSAQLISGAQTINTIAINIAQGAQGGDLDVLNAKVEAANLFTNAIDTDIEIALYTGDDAAAAGRAYLSAVVSEATIPTQAEVDAAVANLQDVNFPGNTIELTGGVDNITVSSTGAAGFATTNNDVINADAGEFTSGDQINAGAGTDTLNAVLSNSITTTETTLVSVEELNVVGATGASVSLDLQETSGVTSITVDANLLDGAAAGDTFIYSVDAGVALEVVGDHGAADIGFSAGEDSNTLTLTDVSTTGYIYLYGDNEYLDTANYVIAGDASVGELESYATDSVVTGEGDLNIRNLYISDNDDEAHSFDASALDGVLTIGGISDNGATITITGTNNIDAITLGTAEETVVYLKSDQTTSATLEVLTGFDATEDALDFSAFDLDSANATTFTQLIDGAAFLNGTSIGLFDTGAGTTVIIDSNGDGNLDLATDFAVSLTGVAAASLTADNFVI